MQVLSQIIIWTLQSVNYILCAGSGLEGHLSMRLIHVVHVVLLLSMEAVLPIVLILENLCQNALGRGWQARLLESSIGVLDVHSSAMHSVKLVFDVVLAAGCPGVRSTRNLLRVRYYPCNEILGLVTAGLDHQSLVIPLSLTLVITRVNRLPRILGPVPSITGMIRSKCVLIPSVVRTSNIALPVGILLVDQPHRQLSNID